MQENERVSDTSSADPISAVAAAVSRNVRTYRTNLQWTIDQLAARARVSKGMIAQVEQGKTNPSIATLARLANALGVNIGTLVESEPPETAQIVTAEQGVKVWTGQPGTVGKLLVSSQGADNTELWDNTIASGDALHSDPHPTGTRELLLVVEGELTIDVGGVAYTLQTGDAAAFRGDQHHAYLNPSAEPVRYSLTVVWPNPRGASDPEPQAAH
ncbi:helix-turn-helix domain-containing protein [Nonomuraea sp. NPDC048826]|uniref:helix-turn-helix domain-containing protein n=1 Tax=Nonomuraea sp. NPDC048826 TaxID=3364347 RepID=UPI003721A8D8